MLKRREAACLGHLWKQYSQLPAFDCMLHNVSFLFSCGGRRDGETEKERVREGERQPKPGAHGKKIHLAAPAVTLLTWTLINSNLGKNVLKIKAELKDESEPTAAHLQRATPVPVRCTVGETIASTCSLIGCHAAFIQRRCTA